MGSTGAGDSSIEDVIESIPSLFLVLESEKKGRDLYRKKKDLYEFLKLERDAPLEQLREKARKISRSISSKGERGLTAEARRKLADACEAVFKDAESKTKYDRSLAATEKDRAPERSKGRKRTTIGWERGSEPSVEPDTSAPRHWSEEGRSVGRRLKQERESVERRFKMVDWRRTLSLFWARCSMTAVILVPVNAILGLTSPAAGSTIAGSLGLPLPATAGAGVLGVVLAPLAVASLVVVPYAACAAFAPIFKWLFDAAWARSLLVTGAFLYFLGVFWAVAVVGRLIYRVLLVVVVCPGDLLVYAANKRVPGILNLDIHDPWENILQPDVFILKGAGGRTGRERVSLLSLWQR